MRTRCTLAAVAALILTAGSAQAQSPFSNVYLSVLGGTAWTDGFAGGATLGPSSGGGFAGAVQPFEIDFKVGSNFAVAVGTALPWSLRAEVEVARYFIGVEYYRINTVVASGDPGDVRTTTAMFNLFRDFDLGVVRPYIGGGIGWGSQDYNRVGGNVFGTVNSIDSSTDGFAWQLMAGLAVPVNANLSVTAGYKYLNIDSPKASGTYTFAGGSGTETLENVEGVIQSINVGLRFKF